MMCETPLAQDFERPRGTERLWDQAGQKVPPRNECSGRGHGTVRGAALLASPEGGTNRGPVWGLF